MLGQNVKDRITGFIGIAISRIQYVSGAIQYGVIPKVGENKDYPKTQYIDESQLMIVGEKREIGFVPIHLKEKAS